jgi:hypothetical protein
MFYPFRSSLYSPAHRSGDPAASEAVAYDMAGEVIGGPAGAPESGTPA